MGAKALVCLMCVAQAAFLPPGRVGRPRLTPSMSMRKKETKTRLPPRAPAPIVTPKTIRVQLANKKGVVVPSKERVVGPVPQFDERGRRLDEYPE